MAFKSEQKQHSTLQKPLFATQEQAKVYQGLLTEGMSQSWASTISPDLPFKDLYQMRLRKTDPNPRVRIKNLPAYIIKLWQYKKNGPQSPHKPSFSYTKTLQTKHASRNKLAKNPNYMPHNTS